MKDDWNGDVTTSVTPVVEDLSNSGIRREPEPAEHEEIAPEPTRPPREFDPPEDESGDDAERVAVFERSARSLARQASLDLSDDMDL
jgi:type IV secretion system protein VirD4